jgi:hypothetical protein
LFSDMQSRQKRYFADLLASEGHGNIFGLWVLAASVLAACAAFVLS